MKIDKNNSNAKVAIQKSDYDNFNIDNLLKPLGGIEKYIKKGEKVLLKTNLLNASEPEKSVVTHPDFIKNIAKEIFKVKAIPIIGDSPSGSFTKRRLEKVYSKSGLIELSNQYGIELNYDTKIRKIDIPNGKRLKKTSVCNFIFEADKVISLPKLKTHSLMIMTLAIKNMYGSIPGLTKARYHSMFIRRKAFAEMLIDILSVVKHDLIIMDGIIAMEGDGPAGGNPVKLGLSLASDNPYAIDLAVCDILNIKPIGIPTLKEAKLRKLWPKKIEYPLLNPNDIKYYDFVLPSTSGYILTGKRIPSKYPIPNQNCIACGECVKICPEKIINIDEDIAKIDYKKCIKCYCCHEICPYNAIKLDTLK
jgi:uncharacterized protein (DUF362 family)/NAD-dependent dihydropyrimidine dehydrogenase PreA subunit